MVKKLDGAGADNDATLDTEATRQIEEKKVNELAAAQQKKDAKAEFSDFLAEMAKLSGNKGIASMTKEA